MDKPPVYEVAISGAIQLRAEIPGAIVEVDLERWLPTIYVRYNCPCGEVSVMSYAVSHRDTPVAALVDYMKNLLREHVRSEGNEPTF